jgi:hypothetical protein
LLHVRPAIKPLVLILIHSPYCFHACGAATANLSE